MAIEIRGVDCTSTIDHTNLGMVIFMAKTHYKLTGVLQKYRIYIDNKRSRVSGVSYGVDGAVICWVVFDV